MKFEQQITYLIVLAYNHIIRFEHIGVLLLGDVIITVQWLLFGATFTVDLLVVLFVQIVIVITVQIIIAHIAALVVRCVGGTV